MAGKGLTIPLSLDPREWLRGIKVVERSLEDFEGSIEEVEDAGKKLGRKLEDVFDEAARDARRSGDKIGDGLSQGMADGVDTSFRSRINNTALGVVGAEVADEFVQSWGEAIRAGNPAEAIYETLTNAGQVLAASLPGAGTVVGMGIATVTGIVQGIRQEEQRVKDAITGAVTEGFDDALSDAQETGESIAAALTGGLIEGATRFSGLQELYGTDSLTEAIVIAQEEAQLLGLSFENDVLPAINGTGDAQKQAAQRVAEARDIAEELNSAYENQLNPLGIIEGLTSGEAQNLQNALNAGNRLVTASQTQTTWQERIAAAAAQLARDEASAASSAGTLRDNLDGASRRMPDGRTLAGNMDYAAQRAADLKYWLDQASRVDVRVAGVTGSGGITA